MWKNGVAFLIVWLCSGIVMDAYRHNHILLAIGFTLLSGTSFIFMGNKVTKE